MYRSISAFKKGYQPRPNTVKDEKGDLFTVSHSILARWRNHFSQLLSVHGVKDVRRTEIHTAEPLVLEPSAFEVELTIENLKSHESPGIDQIPGEFIKAGGRTIRYEIHKLTVYILNKEVPEEWKESIFVPIYKKGDKTDFSNYRGISLLQTMFKVLTNILLSILAPYAEEIIGDNQCEFRLNRSTTDHVFCVRHIPYLRKNGNTTKQYISSL